eukprot:gene12204-biopygen18462
MGPEVGPAFQRRSRATLKFILGVRFGGNGVQALFALFAFLALFVTGGSKRPGNSGLRAAMRTAARARSRRANDTVGIGEKVQHHIRLTPSVAPKRCQWCHRCLRRLAAVTVVCNGPTVVGLPLFATPGTCFRIPRQRPRPSPSWTLRWGGGRGRGLRWLRPGQSRATVPTHLLR